MIGFPSTNTSRRLLAAAVAVVRALSTDKNICIHTFPFPFIQLLLLLMEKTETLFIIIYSTSYYNGSLVFQSNNKWHWLLLAKLSQQQPDTRCGIWQICNPAYNPSVEQSDKGSGARTQQTTRVFCINTKHALYVTKEWSINQLMKWHIVTIVSCSRTSFSNCCWKETPAHNRQTQHAAREGTSRVRSNSSGYIFSSVDQTLRYWCVF